MIKLPAHLNRRAVEFFDPGTCTTWTLSGPCIYRQEEDDPSPVLVRVMPFWRASVVFHRLHSRCNIRECAKEWRYFHNLSDQLRREMLEWDSRISWHGSLGWDFRPGGIRIREL